MDNNGLELLYSWIQKLPDNSDPSLTLKKGVLQIVKSLKLEKDQILSSQIARTVIGIKRNGKNENKELRELAIKIFDSWTQTINGGKSFYGFGRQRKQQKYEDTDV